MPWWWLVPAAPLAYNLGQSFWDNVVRDQTKPARGSVLYCDYAFGAFEHSGIYVGNGLIVNLSGEGRVEYAIPQEFIDGKSAMSIYVSCRDDSAVGSEAVARCAEAAVGTSREYDFLTNNCHKFVTDCLKDACPEAFCDETVHPSLPDEAIHRYVSGELDENTGDALFLVKSAAKLVLGVNTWRVWDLTTEELFGE